MKLSKVVPTNPTCPNCGQSMLLVREGPSSALCADPHVFECARCLVVLMTEDHETLSGVATTQ
jgi:ribosomal protein S27AE